jgi:phosphoglycolate phosphatase
MNHPAARALRLLVFDWDGTLMDSAARIVSCMEAAMRELGIASPGTARVKEIIGLGLHEALDTLFPGAEQALREALAERYRYHFLVADPTPSILFPGVRETLQTLRAQGYLLAVATGKSRRGLDRALDETGLAHLLDATRCADEAFSKPHPQMLLDILDHLAVEPGEALVIGDTEYDLLMARNAAVDAVAVCYGVHEPVRLQRLQPLACLDHVSDLLPWLEGRERRQRAS